MDPQEESLRQQAKVLLRRRARGLRGSMPGDGIAARGDAIVASLLELDVVKNATRVALFWPIKGRKEVDLRQADRALREGGALVAYPSIDPDSRRMDFRAVDDTEQLAERGMRFSEPPSDARIVDELDVIVVPGLLFDPRGYRIGYGGGFYDAALPRFCPPGSSVGVTFDFQLASELPNVDHDVAVDIVVTDTRVLRASD